jgi:light-regulated signal transduction histidine kinase (bacteriophytochrome)
MEGTFDTDDLKMMEEIATRTALAIDGIRLFEEKERELEERRKAEAQVRRLNENLEHIVHERTTELRATNQELEAFCYSVSHDLRAPLRSVDGFSKSLLEDYGAQLDEQAIDYLSRVRNASHRMDELISALLNLSRITRLEIVRQPIDLSQMAFLTVEDVLEGRDRSHFLVKIQPGMTTDADPKLIRVVLDNLIRNSVKFSESAQQSIIEIGQTERGFFVRDNGVGFNPAYAEKLFVAFERLHTQNEFPGSGIGLATVHRIVQKHGGQVWAESQEGKGATFFFTLR